MLGGDDLLLDGLMLDAFGVDAAAVVADFDVDLAALVIGPQPDAAVARLAGRGAALGRFDAMVDGVAHQVRQRVTDRLDQSLVQLGLTALGLQADFLAELPGQLPLMLYVMAACAGAARAITDALAKPAMDRTTTRFTSFESCWITPSKAYGVAGRKG